MVECWSFSLTGIVLCTNRPHFFSQAKRGTLKSLETLSAVLKCVGVPLLILLCTLPKAVADEPPITGIAFAPDGQSVVACSQIGLQVYDWPSLKPLKTIACSASNLHAIVFSPDGKRLAVGGGEPSESGTVEVFLWPKGKLLATFACHSDSIRSLAWLDDSRLVTSSVDRDINILDLAKKTTTRSFAGHSRSVDAVCMLKDGKTLVSGGADQSVRVWDVESGKLIRSLRQHTQTVNALALRPASHGLPMVASCSADRTIRFWQPTIGRMVRYIRLKSEPLAIAWDRKGSHIVASCLDGRVRIVNADTLDVVQTLPAIKGWAYSIAIHPTEDNVLVGGSSGQIHKLSTKPASSK